MKKIILTSCVLVLLIVVLIISVNGFINYYDKPAAEVPLWFWLLFM